MDNKAVPSLLPVYRRYDLAFARGEGSWLYTTDGRRLLDFASGIAVTGLGHAHPHLMATLAEQGGKLWHVSNLFRIPELERLADRLVALVAGDTGVPVTAKVNVVAVVAITRNCPLYAGWSAPAISTTCSDR